MNTIIEKRMNDRIDKVKLYNTLFDIGLTAVEETTTNTGEQQSDSAFVCESGRNANYRYTIICYDNDSQIMSIMVDNITNAGDRIAHLTTECINDEQIWDKMYPLFMKQYWKHLPVGDWRGSSEQLRIIHDDGFPKPWMVQ